MIVQEFNDEAVLAALDRLAAGVDNMSPFFQEFAEVWLQSTQDRVARGESPDGTPFAPRSETTIKRYEKANLSYGAPLNLSGEMRQHLFTTTGPDYVEIASNAIQAAVMHFGAGAGAFGSMSNGSQIPWGNIPARPFLGASEEDRSTLFEMVTEYLEDAAGGN